MRNLPQAELPRCLYFLPMRCTPRRTTTAIIISLPPPSQWQTIRPEIALTASKTQFKPSVCPQSSLHSPIPIAPAHTPPPSSSSSSQLNFTTDCLCLSPYALSGNNEFIIVLDSPSRENEGDLIISASQITSAQVSFMVRYTSGLICAPMPSSLTQTLSLPQMVSENQDPKSTAYTLSVDAANPSISTGISAHDRALTCRVLADPKATEASFRRPGHVFPLRAREFSLASGGWFRWAGIFFPFGARGGGG